MTMEPQKISKTRKIYFVRLWARIIIFFVLIMLYIFNEQCFDVAEGMKFFDSFSPLHILWALWIYDMILQLIPVRAHISIGSQKVFQSLFVPIKEKINKENLLAYIKDTTRSAYRVMIIWIALTITLSILHLKGILSVSHMVIISAFFYVCDLICVLIWCPFRLIMNNKCCTTCRIFNWDHLMMFLPMITVNSFFSWVLVALSVIIWLIWEICVFTYPERFWENSNMALKCSECTDKLCTQYCRKLRKTEKEDKI
ncbi:MAG: hypothetical protein E7396_07850 [Ruminococcaceae bacterium]|nr:hypothetical protein [Oscillospiraceae bacterium]